MIKIAVFRFWYEGNSFSPIPAGPADFARREWLSGAEARGFYRGKGVETGATVDFLDAQPETEATFLRCAAAYPAGPLEAGLFPAFVDEVVAGLQGQQWDGVYASLHGATVAADVVACETYLLERVRAVVGGAVIAASFDLHGNLDPRIGELADIVVGYKTHPHIDMHDTGWKAMTLLHRAVAGEIRPRSVIRSAEFVPTSFNMRTAAGPMADTVQQAARAEADHGFYDVSAFGGFPYADSPHTGASVTVCHDADAQDIDAVVGHLCADFRGRAGQFDTRLPEPAAAIDDFLRQSGGYRMAVLEPSDNIFSGGAGDSPGLLRAALARASSVPSVFAFFWDPDLVARAAAAGPGAVLDCAFGGRLSGDYGTSVQATGTVDTLTDGRFENRGPMEKGLKVELGPSAVIRVGKMRIIVTSRNVPVNDPAYFELHAIDLAAFPLVFVKAKNHFRAAFADSFDAIVDTETPGPAPSDIAGLRYRHAPSERLRFGRMPPMTAEIRPAQASDSAAIAELHVLSWRGSYRRILPDAYLDGDVVNERRAAWARFFAEPPPGAMAFLAPGAEQSLDGFIALEQGHERGYDAVIENLHVAPGAQGRGLGKKLLATAAAHLIGSGAGSACLWVYDANKAAIDFYRALGGVIDAQGIDPFAGADAPHSRIGWRDLAVLRGLCG